MKKRGKDLHLQYKINKTSQNRPTTMKPTKFNYKKNKTIKNTIPL